MKQRLSVQRQGKVVVLAALLLPVSLGMGAFAIDIGHIGLARARLQASADAAALASLDELPNGESAIAAAQNLGKFNFADSYPNIVAAADVEFGVWLDDAQSFTVTGAAAANAVRVTARLSEQNGNPLRLFLGSVLLLALLWLFVGANPTGTNGAGLGVSPETTKHF